MSKQVKFSCNNFSKGLEDMSSQLTQGAEKISRERGSAGKLCVQMKFFGAYSLFRCSRRGKESEKLK